MRVMIKRYHNQARLHVGSGLWLQVHAELDFQDGDTGPTCLRAQVLDWQGVLTFERPPPPDNAFALSMLYEDPRLELISPPAAAGVRWASLPLVSCEIGDVTLSRTSVKICARGPLTEQPLSALLTTHLNQLLD